MKKNNGKGLASDEAVQIEEVLTQSHPAASEKMKTLSRMLDTGSLPSRRDNKKPKHGSFTSSNLLVVNINLSIPPAVSKQPSMAKTPLPDASPSIPFVVAPPKGCPLTLLRSECLAWDRFQ